MTAMHAQGKRPVMADNLWETIRNEISGQLEQEPLLADYLGKRILRHGSLAASLADVLAQKLACEDLSSAGLQGLFHDAMSDDPRILDAVHKDLLVIRQRDPAAQNYFTALLFFKGFQALQAHRMAHWLWHQDRKSMALFLQSQASEVFGVDIHPAARIGSGILIDHATGIVIGETSVLDDNISILQGVTLGGTGKECGDRHPKVRSGVLISAGALILGNIVIGEGAKVGAGSVVLHDVEPHTTVAGVPAVVVGKPRGRSPALDMNHDLNQND